MHMKHAHDTWHFHLPTTDEEPQNIHDLSARDKKRMEAGT